MKKSPEIDNPVPDVPQVFLKEDECSYIDLQITEALQRYMAGAQRVEQVTFRELPGLTQKIDHICWVWGQNPETYQDSLNLKGLLVIRTLEDAVVRREPSRQYNMPILDAYWQQVDRNVYNHFSTYITDETARGIAPYDALPTDTPSALCLMDDYVITRLHETNNMVRYAAVPLHPVEPPVES